MTFRDATLEDLPVIVEIYNSIIPGKIVTADTELVTVSDKLNWFLQHNPDTRPIWMVQDEAKQTIGWVSFRDFYGRPAYSGTAEISMYLDQSFRGKGYGKEMMLYAISQCKRLGIHTLLGFIFEQNTNSRTMASSLGFEVWGNLKEVALMDQTACNLIIMGKKI